MSQSENVRNVFYSKAKPHTVLHNVRGSEVEIENIFTSLSQPGSQGENTLKFGKITGLLFDISWRKTSNLRTYSENVNRSSSWSRCLAQERVNPFRTWMWSSSRGY